MRPRSVPLRPIRRQDAPRLAVLLGQLGYPADATAVNERLDYWLDDPLSYLIGADSGHQLVGVAGMHVCPLLEVTGRSGRLLALVVDERCRGRGVGRSLVTAIEELARTAGCRWTEVTSSRGRVSAHEFYRRLAYSDTCGTKARFVKHLCGAEGP
ncbi:GNAT family N-acetyltransferase [Micromonospora sp. 4G55]|uniref:GNAT family N-acetyltransferase n=1 Tax=Micromonospora sp. 4G55 TaxID=2806102 RepID=UPI001A392780|nr:GNAT family N-acetyltransferase [Micromonospora sp. 4G55]MBM0259427.1 GNAT family N-acetyltransferase [Micromonospora sp. 4G55]